MKKPKKPRRNDRKKPMRGSFRPCPSISGKKAEADFDGDPISSNGGAMLLSEADRCLGICTTLASAIRDCRDVARVTHRHVDILRERIMSICAGYPDANDQDALRHDPSIRMATGKDPFEGVGLASQPTVSRFENGTTRRDVVRASRALIDLYCGSAYDEPPESIVLDIDATFCQTYGEQEGACWSTHHGGHGYAPIHAYDIHTGAIVCAALQPAKTPSGKELVPLARFLIRNVRRHWPKTQIILRGDSHFARWELMDLCEGLEGSTTFSHARRTAPCRARSRSAKPTGGRSGFADPNWATPAARTASSSTAPGRGRPSAASSPGCWPRGASS